MNQKERRRLGRLDTAAEIFDCSVDTVRRMIATGELTGYRLGKRMLRVDLNEVEALAQPVPTIATAS